MKHPFTHKQIFNLTPSAFIVTDITGHIVLTNRKAKKILGMDQKSSTGTNIRNILPAIGSLVHRCLETGEIQLSRYPDDKDSPLMVTVAAIREGEKIIGAVCQIQKMWHIEESVQQSESYKKLHKQLEAVFNVSSDGLWVTDGNGIIININAASEKFNDIKAEDVIGKSVYDLVDEDIFDALVTPRVMETKQPVTIFSYQKRTGRSMLVTGTPVFDEDGDIALVVSNERDFTQLNALKEKLEQNLMVAKKLRDELAEVSLLELKGHKIIAESDAMRQELRVGIKVAQMGSSNVLILGESGTGKGLLAKFIHNSSTRKNRSFVNINCAALPKNLLEAELFGYEKGAFTGARTEGKAGLFELADGGTLLLDEIGDLPLAVQAKLLKYLDDYEILRLGGVKPKKIDCMILAATNRDLEVLTKQSKFRKDLLFRLNAFTIQIPPLRERPEDIFELVNYFLEKNNKEYRTQCRISGKSMKILQAYSFPGNVRELKNIIKKAVVLSDSNVIDEIIYSSIGAMENASIISRQPAKNQKHPSTLPDQLNAFEKEIVVDTIARFKSTRRAASYLGISQSSIMRKKKKYGLS